MSLYRVVLDISETDTHLVEMSGGSWAHVPPTDNKLIYLYPITGTTTTTTLSPTTTTTTLSPNTTTTTLSPTTTTTTLAPTPTTTTTTLPPTTTTSTTLTPTTTTTSTTLTPTTTTTSTTLTPTTTTTSTTLTPTTTTTTTISIVTFSFSSECVNGEGRITINNFANAKFGNYERSYTTYSTYSAAINSTFVPVTSSYTYLNVPNGIRWFALRDADNISNVDANGTSISCVSTTTTTISGTTTTTTTTIVPITTTTTTVPITTTTTTVPITTTTTTVPITTTTTTLSPITTTTTTLTPTTTTTTTLSPTTTTTTTIIVQETSVLFVTGDNPSKVYTYFPDAVPTVSYLLNVENITSTSSDIAHTNNKLWLYNGASVLEWNITLSPWTATYNRSISGVPTSPGLAAINDTKLIGISYPNVYECNITSNSSSNTLKFNTLISGRNISGDYILTTTNKLIITTNSHITQYDYSTGTMEVDISLSGIISSPYGLYEYDNEIYISNGSGNIYLVEKQYPYNITLYDNVAYSIYGASQLPSSLNVHFSLPPTTTTTTLAPTTTTTTLAPTTTTTTTSGVLDCDADIDYSGEYSPDPIVYNINFGSNNGLYVLEYQNYGANDKEEIYQLISGTYYLMDTTSSLVQFGSTEDNEGGGYITSRPLRFLYNQSSGSTGKIEINTSPSATNWFIKSNCPTISSLYNIDYLDNKNYSYYFILENNKNYKLIIGRVSGDSVSTNYFIWDSNFMDSPNTPIVSGNTSSYPTQIIFNTSGATGIVIDIVSTRVNQDGILSINLSEVFDPTTTTTTTIVSYAVDVIYGNNIQNLCLDIGTSTTLYSPYYTTLGDSSPYYIDSGLTLLVNDTVNYYKDSIGDYGQFDSNGTYFSSGSC